MFIISQNVKFSDEERVETSTPESSVHHYVTIELHSYDSTTTSKMPQAPEVPQPQIITSSTRVRNPPHYYGREEANLSVSTESRNTN